MRSVHKAGCQVYRERGREVWRGAGVEGDRGGGVGFGGNTRISTEEGIG